MAAAFKCDRCGKFHTLKDGRAIIDIKRFGASSLLGCSSYEICMDCKNELIKFMEEKEGVEDV